MYGYIAKKNIDKVIEKLQEEKTLNHALITKVLNYSYIRGELYTYYKLVEEKEDVEVFEDVLSYRKKELEELEKYFNMNIISPLYAEEKEK